MLVKQVKANLEGPRAFLVLKEVVLKKLFRFSALTLVLASTVVLSVPKNVDALPQYYWGACSASCEPCWSGNGCPDFFGIRQSCYRYCP